VAQQCPQPLTQVLGAPPGATHLMNRLTNQDREYWYMGSTAARSLMQKKSRDARTACGEG